MSLDHTIILSTYRAAVGAGTLLKVQSGGHVAVNMRNHYLNNPTAINQYVKMGFVWNGNVFMPVGSYSSGTRGWAKYNHEVQEFEQALYRSAMLRHIPVYDRLGLWDYSNQGWSTTPEKTSSFGTTGALTFYAHDYVVIGSTVYALDVVSGVPTLYQWAYPFTTPPSLAGVAFTNSRRICECAGQLYTYNIDVPSTTLRLYVWALGSWTLVGTPTVHATIANYAQVYPTGVAFFKFNGKLFIVLSANASSVTPKMKLFEFNLSTGASIDRTAAWLPAAWQTASTENYAKMFEVRDEIPNVEQVFLFRTGNGTAGWECWEFKEAPFTALPEDSGGEILFAYCGVIYDPAAKSSQFKSAADTIPSNYIDARIETCDLDGNDVGGTADIDPRYRFQYTEPPPYPQCTEKAGVGSEGVLALSTRPAGYGTLALLSDDFDDSIVNPNLWEEYYPCFDSFPTSVRDLGANTVNSLLTTVIKEQGGSIHFGEDLKALTTNLGAGLKGRFFMRGEFQVDFTLSNINNLALGSATPTNCLVGCVRTCPSEEFGFWVWKSNVGTLYVRGYYESLNNVMTFSADFTVANGDIIRLSRSGAGVITITKNPAGTPVDLTPATPPTLTQPMYILMYGYYGTGFWVISGCALGQEPGFSNLAVSGAGTVGKFVGGVQHKFCWDHITDLGASKTGIAELYTDTQRT